MSKLVATTRNPQRCCGSIIIKEEVEKNGFQKKEKMPLEMVLKNVMTIIKNGFYQIEKEEVDKIDIYYRGVKDGKYDVYNDLREHLKQWGYWVD